MRTKKYNDRELSWLDFNQRVLGEALDSSNPLLERLKFLAISASNLDEFFMVRVGGLQLLSRQKADTVDSTKTSSPEKQLRKIRKKTQKMVTSQYGCFLDQLGPELKKNGIQRITPDSLTEQQRTFAEGIFSQELYSILTPIAVTSKDDFPYLANCTINLCVQLQGHQDHTSTRFAILPFGRSLNRVITLPSGGGYEYILTEDVVSLFAERFFPNETVIECVPFRVTRNADLAVSENRTSDLMTQMIRVLDARRKGEYVRLELDQMMTPTSLSFLQQVLDIDDADIFRVSGPLGLSLFFQLANLPGFDKLKNTPWPPMALPQADSGQSIFETIAQSDLILYHPYDSFDPVIRLLEEAAEDPDVLAIKQVLYRTNRNSRVIKALIKAAHRGKYVTVIVELKARFDEQHNIDQAEELEKSGVQVIYGIRDLKTHAKVCLVVRREPQGIQRYVHFGTGNYNESTALLYSDASFMTCNNELGQDVAVFFNAVTGDSQTHRFHKIHVAPIGLREKLIEMIQAEIHRKQQGQEALIMAKWNSLVDRPLIDALYEASQAGVSVKLNIRGICCLRAGVPGLSENIEVVSVIDRFLEHSRIIYFHHGGSPRVYLSSADGMPRNLDRRIELLVPIENRSCADQLTHILEIYFQDNVKGHYLDRDNTYHKKSPDSEEDRCRSQEFLYLHTLKQIKQENPLKPGTFEPHRAPRRNKQ